MRLLVPFLVVAVSLAGCLGGAQDGEGADAGPDPSPAQPVPAPVPEPTITLEENPAVVLGDPFTLVPDEASWPGLAYDAASGALAAVYISQREAYVTTSTDFGATWSDPVRASAGDAQVRDIHGSQPRVVFGDGQTLYALWGAGITGVSTSEGGPTFARSDDLGATWSEPLQLADNRGQYSNDFISMDARGNLVVAAWLSANQAGTEQGEGLQTRVRTSTDGGETWAPSVLVDPATPEEDHVFRSCECCGTGVQVDEDGATYVSWRKRFWDGDEQIRDVVVATGTNGTDFGAPVKVHDDRFVTSSCPHSDPMIHLDDDGRLHSVWWTGDRAGFGMKYAHSDDGTSWSEPVRLQGNAPSGQAAVSVDFAGRAWIFWEDKTQSPFHIRAAVVHPDGVYEPLGLVGPGKHPHSVPFENGFLLVYEDDGSVQGLTGRFDLPGIELLADRVVGASPLEVTFTVDRPEKPVASWSLDFGDGEGTGERDDSLPFKLTHTYATGTHVARLEATFEDGSTASLVRGIQVSAPVRTLPLPEQLVFEEGPLAICLGSLARFGPTGATCASLDAGPEAPPADGFWVSLDERYWGLGADVVGHDANLNDVYPGRCLYLDADLVRLNDDAFLAPCSGTVPEGAAWAFVFVTNGNSAVDPVILTFRPLE